MSTQSPASAPTTTRTRLRSIAASLLTASLILYLAAAAANRTWELLNTDVGELVRRLH